MSDITTYSAQNVFEGLKQTFHQYLEAQYHIWDEGLIHERQRLITTPGTTFQVPRIEATPFYVSGENLTKLRVPDPARNILSLAAREATTGIFATPYLHQAQALEAVLGRNEDVIVATGTGSGKTESFLMPALGSLAIESEERQASWEISGVRAILLYPMNALVNDQLSRLRRLLGNKGVAASLRGTREWNATFGMYTSRTPYAGQANAQKNRERIGRLLDRLYGGIRPAARELLEAEGKWPCKDIERFVASGFETSADDSEMFTRQEMQRRCPDILVTNYSMLEYMMLRPIERTIFDQTREWLEKDSKNVFTVVLDEAHMYRGSGGAEVAYLLRRLHSRLGVSRDRVRYILTSASLGSGEVAEKKIKQFAADLTGVGEGGKPFTLITGTPEKKPAAAQGTRDQAQALAEFDFRTLHQLSENLEPALEAVQMLSRRLGISVPAVTDAEALRHSAHCLLDALPVAALLANRITSSPETLSTLEAELFPSCESRATAVESLLALVTFAKDERNGRVYAPVRSHLFFKGVPGLFACVDPSCKFRAHTGDSLLGQIYSTPQIRCSCGSRVYELLTHRDCGAAFIRGYINGEHGDFLWHEPSTGLWNDLSLLEVHLLIEVRRQSDRISRGNVGSRAWLHKTSGRLFAVVPVGANEADFLSVVRPDALVPDGGRITVSFRNECPVCVRTWQGASKIMDLATKGEAPFAHLIREQVALQPATKAKTDLLPNAGRKSLIFSDGRQKAARLARDIPREIEKDVFRQLLLLAAQNLKQAVGEAVLGRSMYVAFVDAVHRVRLQLFDGSDQHALLQHVKEYRSWHDANLTDALRDFDPAVPASFSEHLLRQLGSRFYSVNALTLAFLRPSNRAARAISQAFTSVPQEELLCLATTWLQGMANDFAFDVDTRHGVRQKAAGYTMSIPMGRGFTQRQREFLTGRGIGVDNMVAVLQQSLCSADAAGRFFINPVRVRLELALHQAWLQCVSCTTVSPVSWWGHCPNCLQNRLVEVQPGETSYLRARKGFWRDPVIRVLSGQAVPINLNVEEHTAQLSYRDIAEPSSTTEEFERRFRDILIRDDDVPIDVLSSTTTMEVGIDIGSLVAVALRNVPPMRQNYQQRAGRAGRRGASISTVVTFAQNSPHDNHYFDNPAQIISGSPTMPGVDVNNRKIIERHVRAQLVEAFFREFGAAASGSGDIFSMLGETWAFYSGDGRFSFNGLRRWVDTGDARASYRGIQRWLPQDLGLDPEAVAVEFLDGLERDRPAREEDIDQANEFLIEFLFSRGYLPAYAFPRDLCSLQIEGEAPREGWRRVPILQRPQQALSVALSEYAPGRLVVVNKKTYRIGSVGAGGASSTENRAERLFAGRRTYVHCGACLYTAGFSRPEAEGLACPVCVSGRLRAVTVIQPEVVFPDGGQEVDEFDDDQVFSEVTSAQLPLPETEVPVPWQAVFVKGNLAAVPDQSMVIVNSGQESAGDPTGFLICSRCGKASLGGASLGGHRRDYRIEPARGNARPPVTCTGEFQRVYLGYSFSSDVLLLRVPIDTALRYDPVERRLRQPLADALQSLCEAVVLGISRELDVDVREVSAGYRFVRHGTDYSADIFVYDTLAGGAGYAVQAAASFTAVLEHARLLVEGCSCGTSCDKCLRHYGNRLHHGSLDRHLAADLIKYIKTGCLPALLTVEAEREVLSPLAGLLKLAGWNVSTSGEHPFQVQKDGRSKVLRAVPSLAASRRVTRESAHTTVFTPYELDRDLAGAYAEIE